MSTENNPEVANRIIHSVERELTLREAAQLIIDESFTGSAAGQRDEMITRVTDYSFPESGKEGAIGANFFGKVHNIPSEWCAGRAIAGLQLFRLFLKHRFNLGLGLPNDHRPSPEWEIVEAVGEILLQEMKTE